MIEMWLLVGYVMSDDSEAVRNDMNNTHERARGADQCYNQKHASIAGLRSLYGARS